jgi:hypothetical protein
MILVNGIPNSGAHAVMSLLASFGMERIPGILNGLDPKHPPQIGMTLADPYVEPLDVAEMKTDRYFLQGHVLADHADLIGSKVIWILRHPRNLIASVARNRTGFPYGDHLPDVIRSFNRVGVVKTYRAFMDWHDKAMVIRYEDIPREFTEPHPALYQDSNESLDTYSGAPSDWRDLWTDEADEFWYAYNGPELETDLGYAI